MHTSGLIQIHTLYRAAVTKYITLPFWCVCVNITGWNQVNSIPSYFKSVSNLIWSMSILPVIVNAVMYVAVFPLISSVCSATMTLSSVPGTNLKLENPWVGLYEPKLRTWTLRKYSSVVIRALQPMCSSRVSLYRSLEQRRGRKNHLRCSVDHMPDSWII